MSKFNTKKETKAVKNLAGGKAFDIKNPKQELFYAALTTFFKDQFYETGEERLERVKALIAKIVEKDGNAGAVWLCKLAIVLREQFHMRSIVHVIVGELGKTTHGSDILSRTIDRIAQRPDDLSEIAAYVGLPMPKQVKRGIRRAIQRYDRYQLAKYKMEGKEFSLVDLFNLTHPNSDYVTEETRHAWGDLLNGNLKSEDTWETELSNAKDDKARRLALCDLISENKIGYMALLRNLNNLLKYDVPVRIMNIALEKLVDEEQIRKSKLLPFRFWNAYKNVKGNTKVTDAISEAMDKALENTQPHYWGRTLIAIDSSGSMHGIGDDTSHFEKASILAAIILKGSGADVILYSNQIYIPTLSSRDPIASTVASIESQKISGGTETGLVFDFIASKNKEYNTVIILSDNESWSGSVMGSYENMKKSTGFDPKVFAVDIAGYGTFDVEGKKVTKVSGWSDRILEFFSAKAQEDGYMDYIKNVYIAEHDVDG